MAQALDAADPRLAGIPQRKDAHRHRLDEASASDSTACCDEPAGPNVAQPGFSTLLARFGIQNRQGSYPGGGKVGAVVLNRKYILPGSVDTTGLVQPLLSPCGATRTCSV
jgi:hypothetical protein